MEINRQTKQVSDEEPFFIIGPQRSGTTLLRLMLSSHSRLIIPPESHFIPDLIYLENKFGSISKFRMSIISWLIKHKRFSDFGLEPELVEKALQNLEPFDTKNIVLKLFQLYAVKHKKSRWGDKTPAYRNHIPELSQLFPRAKFILMVRDGRDTALSMYTVPFGPNYLSDCAVLWKKSIYAARKGIKQLPPARSLELKYEDLIQEPQKYLEEVCAFLEEEFEPPMLQYFRHGSKLIPAWETAWHLQTREPINSSNLEKWRIKLKPWEITLIEMLAGNELVKHGYQLEKPIVSSKDLLLIYRQIFFFLYRQIKRWMVGLVRKNMKSFEIMKEIKH